MSSLDRHLRAIVLNDAGFKPAVTSAKTSIAMPCGSGVVPLGRQARRPD